MENEKNIKKTKKKSKKENKILIFFIFSLLGILSIIYSVFAFKTYVNKSNTYIETTAYVCGYDFKDNLYNKDYSCDEDSDYEYDYRYYDKDKENGIAIIIEYEVEDKVYHATSDSYNSNPKFLGTPVVIKYNPNNPEDIMWESSVLFYILMGGLGILFLAASVTTLVKKKKEE